MKHIILFLFCVLVGSVFLFAAPYSTRSVVDEVFNDSDQYMSADPFFSPSESANTPNERANPTDRTETDEAQKFAPNKSENSIERTEQSAPSVPESAGSERAENVNTPNERANPTERTETDETQEIAPNESANSIERTEQSAPSVPESANSERAESANSAPNERANPTDHTETDETLELAPNESANSIERTEQSAPSVPESADSERAENANTLNASQKNEADDEEFEPVQSVLFLELEDDSETELSAAENAEYAEYEKYACAFSSNIIELNGLYHDSFDPTHGQDSEKAMCAKILRDSWHVGSYVDFLEQVSLPPKRSQSNAYRILEEVLKAHPKKSVPAIIKDAGLTALEGTRLFFIAAFSDVLGEDGVEAWDSGREITFFRLAAGAGYISREDALRTLKPLINTLRAKYSSWDEYFARYIAGCQFSELSDNAYSACAKEVQSALNRAKLKMNFDLLSLAETEESENDMQELFVDMVLYTPTAAAKKWEEVLTLSKQADSLKNTDLKKIGALLAQYPAMPCIRYLRARAYINSNLDYIAIKELAETLLMLEGTNHASDLYFAAAFDYANLLWAAGRPADGKRVLEALAGENREKAAVHFLLGCCCLDLFEEPRAYGEFSVAKEKNYELPTFIDSWVKKYETNNASKQL